MMPLRHYQQAAIDDVYAYLRQHDGNPVVVLPTGAGKSWCIAQICADAVNLWGGRVLVLAHVRELLEQNAEKVRLVDTSLDVGLYSAGLNSRDTENSIVVAGIQSVAGRIDELCRVAPFDLIVIDEAHMVPVKETGRYRQLLSDMAVINPQHRVVGMTATPYRLDAGTICDSDGIFSDVCHEVGVRQMVNEGWLCRMVGRRVADSEADMSSVRVRAGDFAANEMQDAFLDCVDEAVNDLLKLTESRRSVLIFAAGVEHAKQIHSAIQRAESMPIDTVATVTGDTPKDERDSILSQFTRGEIRYVVNCNVLTTGFDAPNIDCVAVIRATKSPGLFSQMVGRGFRNHAGKQDCLLLDFGGNLRRHGPVDAIKPPSEPGAGNGEAWTKTCDVCKEEVAVGFCVCPCCGFEFPPPDVSHEATAANDAVMSDEVEAEDYDNLRGIYYAVHRKRGWKDGDPLSVRVDYVITSLHTVSEWVCVEHGGFARRKAIEWWETHSNHSMPETAPEAVDLLNAGAARQPTGIRVIEKPGELPRITGRIFSDPVPDVNGVNFAELMDEVPF